jgi:hypothetical protein
MDKKISKPKKFLTMLTFQEPPNFFTKGLSTWDCIIIKKNAEVPEKFQI